MKRRRNCHPFTVGHLVRRGYGGCGRARIRSGSIRRRSATGAYLGGRNGSIVVAIDAKYSSVGRMGSVHARRTYALRHQSAGLGKAGGKPGCGRNFVDQHGCGRNEGWVRSVANSAVSSTVQIPVIASGGAGKGITSMTCLPRMRVLPQRFSIIKRSRFLI